MGFWTALLTRELARSGQAAAEGVAYSKPPPRTRRKVGASEGCTPCQAKARVAAARQFAGLPDTVPRRRR